MRIADAGTDVAAPSAGIPARLDRLPWSAFHWRMASALGIAWALDGLEVTLAGTFGEALRQSPTLGLGAAGVGLSASAYLTGAVLGSVLLGYLADRYGRKRLYSVTLGIYLVGALASTLAWSFASFALARFVTGIGIGGEYSAINSAIQEFTPPRLRGRVDLVINGSFWTGALTSAVAAWLLQTPALIANDLGWRIAFAMGTVLGVGALLLRRLVPESPRWLAMHGRGAEAEAVVRAIESGRRSELDKVQGVVSPAGPQRGLSVLPYILRALFSTYRQRTLLGLSLMTAQAFCYNAIFFSYALILGRFYGVSGSTVGGYAIPFAIGNFLGPLCLGSLFDIVGRKQMIAATYALAGLMLAVTGALFFLHLLDETGQIIAWSITFFVASAAASAAYLTVGESFPLQIRAMVIALFYAAGTLLGGVAGPALFGALVAEGSRGGILLGYLLAAILMIGAAIVELVIGLAAEGRSLESLATMERDD